MATPNNTENVSKKEFKTTLIVGIGGTGKEVLLRLRKKFYDKYGTIDGKPIVGYPIMGYLLLETDLTRTGADMNPLDPIFDQVWFDESEILDLQMKEENVSAYFTKLTGFPHIESWIYKSIGKAGTKAVDGTGQIRPLGRLCFFHHYDKIVKAVKSKHDAIRNIRFHDIARSEPFNLDINPKETEVHMIFSIAGGTGSGMFLDMAFLLKKLLGNSKIFAYITLPDLYNNDRRFANGYAALKEIEKYMYGRDVGKESVEFPIFKVEWKEGEIEEISGPPFDLAFLMSGKNKAGIVIDDMKDAFELIADYLFLYFSKYDFSSLIRSKYPNISTDLVRSARMSTEDLYLGREYSIRYASLGFSKISVDKDRIVNYCSYKLGEQITEFWINPKAVNERYSLIVDKFVEDKLNPKRNIEDIITKIPIKQEKPEGETKSQIQIKTIYQIIDEVANKIYKLKPSEIVDKFNKEEMKLINYSITPSDYGEIPREILGEYKRIWERKRPTLDLLKDRWDGDNVGKIIGNLVDITEAKIKEILTGENREHGVRYAIEFLRELKTRLDKLFETPPPPSSSSKEIFDNAQILEKELRKIDPISLLFKGITEEVLRERIREGVKQYLKAEAEKIKNDAINILKSLYEEYLDNRIRKLEELEQYLENTQNYFRDRKEQYAREKYNGNLSIILTPPDVDKVVYGVEREEDLLRYIRSFLNHLRSTKDVKDGLYSLSRLPISNERMNLKEILYRFGVEQFEKKVEKMEDKFDVVNLLYTKPDKDALISKFAQTGLYWIEFGEGYRNLRFRNPVNESAILGRSEKSPKKTHFDEAVRNKLLQYMNFEQLEARDATRESAYLYTLVAGFPLFVIKEIDEWQKEYREKLKEGLEIHASKEYASFEDILPVIETDKNKMKEVIRILIVGPTLKVISFEKREYGYVVKYRVKRGAVVQEVEYLLDEFIDKLIKDDKLREALLKATQRQKEVIRKADPNNMGVRLYFMILNYYLKKIFTLPSGSDEETIPSQIISEEMEYTKQYIHNFDVLQKTVEGWINDEEKLKKELVEKNLKPHCEKVGDGYYERWIINKVGNNFIQQAYIER